MKQHNHSVNTNSKLAQHLVLKLFAVLLIGFATSTYAADLRVMKTGLGKGWIQGSGISCGIVSTDPRIQILSASIAMQPQPHPSP